MPVESAPYINSLNPLYPQASDPKSDGDDHLRNLKQAIKATFPNIAGPMTVAHDQVASKADIAAAQFSSSLPAQSIGFLRSDGANPVFGTTHVGYAQNEVKGADIASAATINLATATGNFVHVTGTTTITAITIPVGADRTIIFDGALTLTHSAGLLLPGAANIVTAAGDRMIVRGDASGAIVTHYQRASGKAVVETAPPTVPPPVYALLGSASVSAAVANIDFLSLFTATYDKYVIEVQGIAASASDQLAIRLAKINAADAGALYTTAGSEAAGAGSATQTLCALTSSFNHSGNYTVEVLNANNAVKAKSIVVHGTYYNTASAGYGSNLRAGVYAGANVATGFRLFFASGANFTEGTVRVYGVRNS